MTPVADHGESVATADEEEPTASNRMKNQELREQY